MATSEHSQKHDRPRTVGIILALIAILVIGASFRLYNVNWDKGTYHIHPDERHTTMVVTAIQWPASIGEYFDTSRSPLNPRNANTVYFYGTLPLFLTKSVATQADALLAAYSEMRPDGAEWAVTRSRLTSYDQIHLVGRVLSALFDLGSVLLLFFLARRLFDWRVGLIASLLLALAVLNIQGSHYFTVDTFLTFFVALTLWFTLNVVEGKGWPAFLALGVSMGLTLASKVSVFLLAVVVGLGAWLWVRRQVQQCQSLKRALLRAAGGLLLASIVAIAIFRVAQPYAWAGPNYSRWDLVPQPWGERLRVFEKLPDPIEAVVTPNPQWVADIVSAGAQQTGEADLPWGRQWTERTPWLYPLENMVLWGLGVPLGIAAWLGVGLAIVSLVRAWHQRRAGRPGDSRSRDRRTGGLGDGRWDLILILLAWVLLTFVWQGMQYVKSIRYFLPIYPYLAMFAAYLVVSAWDWAKVRRWQAKVGAGLLGAFVLAGTLAWAWAFIQIYREPVTRVQATRWMYENIEEGAAIANEHFDDPLPFNMDGRVAFGSGSYQGLELALYNEDTPEKLEEVLDVLDEADYISMSSGRLHTSIPRLPMRYPVTTRYYELLFAEKLGFEKAAEFHSYPRLFGIEFNDDRAEEQFTVYDHPKVLIYRKTDDYNRDRVRAMLAEGIDWDQIAHWLNPRDVPEWKRTHQRQNEMMLTEAQREVQAQGGTWALLFDRDSLPNRLPTLAWLVLIGLVGLAALPLTVGVFRWLPDRGYILARMIGVLLLAWLSWILTNLAPLGYSRVTILLALALVALGSWSTLVFASQRRQLRDLWRTRKGFLLANELLFLAFFLVLWLIRWGNPDLWHAWKGGEKPMDLAYLNAVIKSTEFPPYDPWFAGGYLNYYYFGQVMVGTLIKLIGIVPGVAYNLAIPTWFAMTAMGAFSVTYNLVAKGSGGTDGESSGPIGPLRPLFFGLVGALFVAVLGNLGQIPLVLLKVGQGMGSSFQSTIPGLEGLVRTIHGSLEVIFGERAMPVQIAEWYWNASRAIPAGPYESVITEFPFFTFLYADLHAHLIALPLTFISLAMALSVVKESERSGGSKERGWHSILKALPGLLLWSLAIGAMRTTNTWDVPPHLIVVFGALVIAQVSLVERSERRWPSLAPVASVAWQFGIVALLSWSLLYWPFWSSYAAFYNSLDVWTGTRTVLWAYLLVHGLFLFGIISYLSARVIGDRRQDPLLHRLALTLRYWGRKKRLRDAARIVGVQGVPVSSLIWIMLGILVLIELFFLSPGLISFTQPKADVIEADAYVYRGLVVFALALPVALMGLMLLFRPAISATERLWTYLILLGLAMTLGVEVIVLQGDIGRMNTVFKFYLQAWLVWGVTAAAALAWMVPRLWRWQHGRGLWLGVLVLLLLLAALYTPLATWAKVNDRFDTEVGPGLDGWAYMETARYWDPNGPEYDLRWDLEAMQWLQDNVVGSPTILEGHTPEYRWGARYSINTGLPTILGWNWHQRQQRAAGNQQAVWDRANDVARIYNTLSSEQAESLLREYDVRYAIIGPLERAYYEPGGLEKFERMATEGTLEPVFGNGEVTIYKVVE